MCWEKQFGTSNPFLKRLILFRDVHTKRHRPLNSHGATVRLTISALISQSHGGGLISHGLLSLTISDLLSQLTLWEGLIFINCLKIRMKAQEYQIATLLTDHDCNGQSGIQRHSRTINVIDNCLYTYNNLIIINFQLHLILSLYKLLNARSNLRTILS